MPLNIQMYSQIRPMLFHITAASNIESIRSECALHSAKILDPELAPERRIKERIIIRGKHAATLRDQLPLQEGYVTFDGGWRLTDLIAALNERVHFWPGTEEAPHAAGRALFQAYSDQRVLRISFWDLLLANPHSTPYFCKYNSGGPRTVRGQRSPRGPDTFLVEQQWTYTCSDVKEVSFLGSVRLSENTKVLQMTGWKSL
jgi:hypothetical protein